MALIVGFLSRSDAEQSEPSQHPYAGTRVDSTRIGERIVDEQITIHSDPMDPECGFPPFSIIHPEDVYHPVTWVERGVLRELGYPRSYGVRRLGKNTGYPNSNSFVMSGGPTSVKDMIQTTRRGLLVTRFSDVAIAHDASILCSGYTRDGLWLIENGKIGRPVKNFRFVESPLFMLNNVLELGPPQRVFSPGSPIVAPPIKVRDFSFTSLADAV